MPQPWITYLIGAIIAGIILGIAIADEWHRRRDTPDGDVHLIARCPTHGLHGRRDHCYQCGQECEQVPMLDLTTTPADQRTNTGEIAAAAHRAALGATRDAIARWPESEAKERALALQDDPKVRALLDEITAGILASTRPRPPAPLLVVTSDEVPQGSPYLLGDDGFEVMVGAPKSAILKGLGY